MDTEDHSDFELVDKRQLMQSSLVATARVFFVACLGIYVAKRNLVKTNDLKALSNLVEHLLLPCLIFTNFITTLDLTDWKFWLPCMLVSLLIILTGGGLGYLFSEFLVRNPRVRYIIMASCAFGHATSIQLYLVQSLSYLLDLIPSTYETSSLNRGIAYIMIVTLVNNLFRWSVGKKFIEYSKDNQVATQDAQAAQTSSTPQSAERSTTKSLKGFFNPPIIAALISVVICMIPPLKAYLADPTKFIHRAFFVPVQLTGRSLTPVIIIILGCSLGHGQLDTSRLDK
eukprot:TRINITY_DN13946_c0_g4_i5.p1 TRINITY_DN13946_c0_g4~~TRINITY_DN13946_c0_g4_i5.p1  ORF type:complete len:285 (+),score=67.20 TRINITY_DN13946_c0_g4_i5:177-1031(+)